MSRKITPDIMANLMSSPAKVIGIEHEVSQTVKPENYKTIFQNSGLQSRHKAIKPENIKTISKAMPETIKEKTTFNLSQHTLLNLEDMWMKLRRKLKGEQRITKTLIVEKAIEMAIADFESKSELGDLFARLKENNE